VQCSTDSFDECDGYNLTTSAEPTDVEEEEAQTIKKRHHHKRSFNDFLTWSAGMYSLFYFHGLLAKNGILDKKG